MSLRVNYKQAKDRDEAYTLAKAQITPEYIDKFNVKADISYEPEKGKMTATGKGFTLSLKFNDSSVDADLELSFLLKAFKGKILDAIERKLEKHV